MATQSKRQRLSIAEILVLGILGATVLFGGVFLANYWITHKPTQKKRPPPPQMDVVEVQELKATDHQVIVSVKGTVIPAVEIDLKPRVSGEVTSRTAEFIEGGLVKAGETVVTIDPRDYELALAVAEARVETARYQLALEEGQQDIAKREWELMGVEDGATTLDRELALRKPHLREKNAQFKAAQADVDKANLNLARTEITAPFNAIVQAADIDIGDQATPQGVLGKLVGTDAYWVLASIPLDDIRWIRLPNGNDDEPTTALIRTGIGAEREGRVLKLLSNISTNGRMARLLIEVEDPLDLCGTDEGRKPLLLNEYVRVDVQGRSVENVFVVPRNALRDGRRLWLLNDENKLAFRDADIVKKDAQVALLRGCAPGEQLIVSDIAAPVVNMNLQTKDSLTSGVARPGIAASGPPGGRGEGGPPRSVPGGNGDRRPEKNERRP